MSIYSLPFLLQPFVEKDVTMSMDFATTLENASRYNNGGKMGKINTYISLKCIRLSIIIKCYPKNINNQLH